MIELTLPEFDERGSTKDLVMLVLLKNHPLSAKQLWYRVNKGFGKSISYQGVYKTVSMLKNTGVLRKSEIGYEISLDWIKRVKEFTEALEGRYCNEPSL
jgi:hypothetical protein